MAALGAIGDLTRDTAKVLLQVGACLQQLCQEWENIGSKQFLSMVLNTIRAQVFLSPDWVSHFLAVV
ncbi:hypothetical protein E2C01_045424 [Portunus trituberculatus]|uniref:Uncharacterized protein n=1 Tax=Portunus trituberculatus TaxID=210409 RepID=A0A5B7G278_PORTR|nr:hypothetical protein [Portunus trituberculatus]